MVQFDNVERKENLSYAIGCYRKKKGYSQEQMAERLGISRQHLAFYSHSPALHRILRCGTLPFGAFVFLLSKRKRRREFLLPASRFNYAAF